MNNSIDNPLTVNQLKILAHYPTSKCLESPAINSMSLAQRITMLSRLLAQTMEETEAVHEDAVGESI